MWTTEDIEALYRQHSYAVFRRCRQLLKDESDAQEMVQEVFLHFLEHPDRFKKQSKSSTYLYAIASNRCLNTIRDRAARGSSWQAAVSRHLAKNQRSEGDDGGAAARILTDRILTIADAGLAEIALYHYVDGLSQGEIAALVGVSRITVNKRLRRFRKDALRALGEQTP